WAWHSQRPLDGTGLHLVRALNSLSHESSPEPQLIRHLILGLLSCVKQHLLEDGDKDQSGSSRKIWRTVLEHLNLHYADPMLSRDKVAAAVGIHPNYLSSLASREGEGFHAAMEDIRITRARHLLENGALKLDEVARQCGYSGAV